MLVLPFLGIGLAAAIPLLLWSGPDDLIVASTVHLAGVVILGLSATMRLASLADDTWFAGTGLDGFWRRIISAAGITALVTGMVALVTMATGAAIGFAPSLQYLQLLGAMDIAWATTALMIGLLRWSGFRAAIVGGLAVAAICVWSIWRYLDVVGFTEEGGWLVDGDRLLTLVIPVDMAAAVLAIVVLLIGTRHAQRTEHANPQS